MSADADTLVVEGRLTFHSETGTEGGLWAIQSFDSITREAPPYGVWRGSTVWDAEGREGKVAASFHADGRVLPDPMHGDPDYGASSLFRGASGDREADARLAERWGFTLEYPVEREGYVTGSVPTTEPKRPYGVGQGDKIVAVVVWDGEEKGELRAAESLLIEQWSYDGLFILKDGDRLTTVAPDGTESAVTVKLRKVELFTEDVAGMWLRKGEQEGVPLEEWARPFLDGWTGRLER